MKHTSNDTQQERIGKRLKQVRQYLLLTQQQVGEATAIPVITISKIEHDKSVNSDSFIQLLLFYSNYDFTLKSRQADLWLILYLFITISFFDIL